ncbi:MAG: hypothetical protein HY716_02090 [Planctomycetes bacterium]|nr:hypothetical protein [Planctomycetota bacterium]
MIRWACAAFFATCAAAQEGDHQELSRLLSAKLRELAEHSAAAHQALDRCDYEVAVQRAKTARALEAEVARLREKERAVISRAIDAAQGQRISLRFEQADLLAILDEIQERSGFRIEMDRTSLKGVADLDVSSVTAMEALDALCLSQKNLTYEWKDAGHFRVMAGQHAAQPSTYWGAYKIYLTSLDVQRMWDFQDSRVNAVFTLDVVRTSPLKALPRIGLRFEKGQDDTGHEFAVTGSGSRYVQGLPFFGGGPIQPGYPFVIKGLSPEAKTLPRLAGMMTLFYPLAPVEVSFEAPFPDDRQESGEFEFTFNKTGKGFLDFTIKRADGGAVPPEEFERRLDSDSFLVQDDDGVDHEADGVAPGGGQGGLGGFFGGLFGGGAAEAGKYRATFPTFTGGGIKRFRFRFADRTFEREVPFELRDVKLP